MLKIIEGHHLYGMFTSTNFKRSTCQMKYVRSKSMHGFCLLVLSAGLLFSCSPQAAPTSPDDIISEEGYSISNDESTLNARLAVYDDTTLTIFAKQARKKKEMKLNLIATLDPPEIAGQPLSASHVTIKGNTAFVSYSTKGRKHQGGLELVDVSSTKKPKVISQILLENIDVTVAEVHSSNLVLGVAVDSENMDGFSSPAAVQFIKLKGKKLDQTGSLIDLPSFNANDIFYADNRVFVTSGSTGGMLTVFDKDTVVIHQLPVENAKAVAMVNNMIVALEGTGTRLHLYEKNSMDFIRSIEVGCENFIGAKSEIAVQNDYVFVSGWHCGVRVIDVNNNAIVGQFSLPAGQHCNAVSVDGDLAFLANDDAGITVLNVENDGSLSEEGTIQLAQNTNYVAFKGNKLFVANGLNGISIIEIKK